MLKLRYPLLLNIIKNAKILTPQLSWAYFSWLDDGKFEQQCEKYSIFVLLQSPYKNDYLSIRPWVLPQENEVHWSYKLPKDEMLN